MPVDFVTVKGSDLPVAGGVSDSDIIIIIQNGVTSQIRKDLLAASFGTGTGTGLTVVEVEVAGSESLLIPGGLLLIHEVFEGSPGTVKLGTTDGGGEIIDDAIAVDVLEYSQTKFFKTDTTLWLNGTFTARLYLS